MKFTIKHDTKSQKFYTEIGGKECSLRYDRISDQLLNFKMIYVPKNLRGQGIAGRIMESALTYVRKNMMKVKSTCNYVDEYMYHCKEHTDLLFNYEGISLQEA